MSAKLTKLRFTIFDDLVLLREVIGQNPYQDISRWREIHLNVVRGTSKNFSIRTVKEHVEHLLKLFKKNDRANLRKSGTEEQYDEKDQLLQQIVDLQREFSNITICKRGEIERLFKKKGCAERDMASTSHFSEAVEDLNIYEDANLCMLQYAVCNNFSKSPLLVVQNDESELPDIDVDDASVEIVTQVEFRNTTQNNENDNTNGNIISTYIPNKPSVGAVPHRKSSSKLLKNSSIQFLKERKEAENRIRERELDLEERRLAIEEKRIRLEEAKFESEKAERERRLQMEIEERSHRIQIEKQQLDLNNVLIKQLINK